MDHGVGREAPAAEVMAAVVVVAGVVVAAVVAEIKKIKKPPH
jgi:hypothetical protein